MCLVVTCVSVSTSKLLCTNRVRYFTCLHRTQLHCCASCIIAYRKTVAAVAALARGVKVSFEVKLCREMVVVRNRCNGSSFLSSNARPLLFLNRLSNICKPLARTNQFFTSCGVFCGFFFFVPPQTLEGVDVHCFGHLLYEMTYGRPPDTIPVDSFPPAPSMYIG